MRFLNWLMGRPKTGPTAAVAFKPERQARIISDEPTAHMAQPQAGTETKAGPLAVPVTDPAEGDTFHLDYATADGPVKRRRVEFIFASPGSLVTGVDLDRRRLRTYRLDRMRRIIRPADGLEFEPVAFFGQFPVIDNTGFHPVDVPHETALGMRNAMYCQLSLLLLMSTADGPLRGDQLDVIMKYAQRENRFATREGWVQTGDKRAVWPLLRGIVNHLRPRPDLVDVFVGTLQENWENPRRFSALNDALTDLAHMGGGPSAARTALAAAINRRGA